MRTRSHRASREPISQLPPDVGGDGSGETARFTQGVYIPNAVCDQDAWRFPVLAGRDVATARSLERSRQRSSRYPRTAPKTTCAATNTGQPIAPPRFATRRPRSSASARTGTPPRSSPASPPGRTALRSRTSAARDRAWLKRTRRAKPTPRNAATKMLREAEQPGASRPRYVWSPRGGAPQGRVQFGRLQDKGDAVGGGEQPVALDEGGGASAPGPSASRRACR